MPRATDRSAPGHPGAPAPDVEHRPATPGSPALEIHRSPRRRRSASAAPHDRAIVVRLPVGLPDDEEERLIDSLVRKVTGPDRASQRGGDAALERRAAELADRYLDGVRPTSVRWSGRMRRRYGSCSPAEGTIRISRELTSAPAYVLDHVLVHELAHLRVPGHDAEFHALVDRFPGSTRARGWLEGFTAGQLAAGITRPDGDGALDASPEDPVDGGAVGDRTVADDPVS